MLRIIVALGAVLFTTAPAQASDWWVVGFAGREPRRFIHFIDKDSIRTVGVGRVQVWVSTYNETPTKERSNKSLLEVNCTSRTLKILSYVNYDSEDAVMGSGTFKSYEVPEDPAVPDSIGDRQVSAACGQMEEGAFEVDDTLTPAEAGRKALGR